MVEPSVKPALAGSPAEPTAEATGEATGEPTAPHRDWISTGSMGRDGFLNISGMVVSTFAVFGVAMLLAHTRGLAAVGNYSTIFAARAVLTLFCGLGMRIALTRFVAGDRARGDYGRLRGNLLLGSAVPVIAAVVLSAILWAASSLGMARLFDGAPEGQTWIRILAVGLPFSVLMDVALAASRGFQDARPAVRIGSLFEPLARLGLTAVVVVMGGSTTGALVALTVSTIAAAALALRALARQLAPYPSAKRSASPRELANFASISWVASLATQGLLWADVLILSVMSTSREVGIYQIATRLVLLAMVCITPLTQSLAPRVAHYWETGDVPALRERYRTIVLWSWRLTIPLFACLLVTPDAALHLFGGHLSEGTGVVYILSCGAIFESFAAPSAVLLNQVGRNGLNMVINVSNLVMNVVLNILLIPVMGINGSALAWSISLAVAGALRVYIVRRLVVHELPFTAVHLRAAMVAFGATIVAWLVVHAIAAPWWLELVLATACVLSGYVLGVMRFATTRRERKIMRKWRGVLVREFLTRWPWLRRRNDRRRLSGLPRGERVLSTAELISPFRYDVYARHALYLFADRNEELRRHDFNAFIVGAADTLYGHWFQAVMIDHLGLQGASPRLQERAFRQSIKRSLELLESFERSGYDHRSPISVVRLPAGDEVGGRALAEDRWLTVDGNHRLALLLRENRTHLEPHEYVVDSSAVPRNNTQAMAEATQMTEAELCAFYARGLVAPERWSTVKSWSDLLGALSNPANRAPMERWPEHTRFPHTGRHAAEGGGGGSSAEEAQYR